MHAGRILEPAQALRLVRNDALRLLFVGRPTGNDGAASTVIDAPMHINARIHPHVFKVVARAASAPGVKHAVLGVHHNISDIESNRCGRRGIRCLRQLVGINKLVRCWSRVCRCRGIAQRRDGKVRLRVIRDREVAVIHVPICGTECGSQVAGRRRREQVFAFGDVQQLVVTGCAGHNR
jgi:hypothetical protein